MKTIKRNDLEILLEDGINMQLFAVDPDPEDEVEDEVDLDSLGLYDPDEETEEEETEGIEDDNPNEDEEDTEEDNPEDKTPGEEKPKQEGRESEEGTDVPKTFTQEDVDRIIAERLSRDRKSQFVQQLEADTGMTIDQVVEHVRKSREGQQVQKYVDDYAISEEEAQRIVQKEQENATLKAKMAEIEGQQRATQAYISYSQDKAKYAANPLVKKYEKEIDSFSQNGVAVGFEAAMNYVIGQKALKGELLQDVRNGAEQKTLANVNKRGKVAPESGGGSGKAETLSKEERMLAANFGVSPKEWAAAKSKKK